MKVDFQVYVIKLREEEYVHGGGKSERSFGVINMCNASVDI